MYQVSVLRIQRTGHGRYWEVKWNWFPRLFWGVCGNRANGNFIHAFYALDMAKSSKYLLLVVSFGSLEALKDRASGEMFGGSLRRDPPKGIWNTHLGCSACTYSMDATI